MVYDYYANLLDGDVIEINEDATTPEHLGTKWWIKDLQLALSDRNALLSGKDLTEAIMNAVQMMFQNQFPRVKGLRDTGFSFPFFFNNKEECCSDISC